MFTKPILRECVDSKHFYIIQAVTVKCITCKCLFSNRGPGLELPLFRTIRATVSAWRSARTPAASGNAPSSLHHRSLQAISITPSIISTSPTRPTHGRIRGSCPYNTDPRRTFSDCESLDDGARAPRSFIRPPARLRPWLVGSLLFSFIALANR